MYSIRILISTGGAGKKGKNSESQDFIPNGDMWAFDISRRAWKEVMTKGELYTAAWLILHTWQDSLLFKGIGIDGVGIPLSPPGK